MRLYCALSQTGGVGKSTSTWGLAMRAARMNPAKRVLFIDFTKSQGTRSKRVAPELEIDGKGIGYILNRVFSACDPAVPYQVRQRGEAEAYNDAARMFGEFVVPVYGDRKKSFSIDVMPASSAYLAMVIEKRWVEAVPGDVLGKVLGLVNDKYDYCFCDVSPDVACPSVRSIMAIADTVVAVQSVKGMDTIQGLGEFMEACRRVNGNLCGFIANFYNPKTKASRRAMGTLALACEESGLPLIAAIPEKASITNTTEVRGRRDGVISGLYAELEPESQSDKATLLAFEQQLARVLSALDGEAVTNICSDYEKDRELAIREDAIEYGDTVEA